MKSAADQAQRISRKMSYLLRHSTAFIDGHGWAQIGAIVEEVRKSYPDFTEAMLREIVAADEKGRYSIDASGLRIRANQGHSVPVDVELKRAEPPEVLYHGTASRFLSSIMAEGLTGRTRLYVHLSTTAEAARKVGARHGKPVALQIDTSKMARDGYDFFLSENHIWLTKAVPAGYITIL